MGSYRSMIFLSLTILVVFSYSLAYGYSLGEELPNPNPSIAYYDERQALSKLYWADRVIPEYQEFWIDNPPREVYCDAWTPVTGHIHDKGGQLKVTGVNHFSTHGVETKFITPDDIFHANLSYQTDFELQNYFKVPCTKNMGEWKIAFTYVPKENGMRPTVIFPVMVLE